MADPRFFDKQPECLLSDLAMRVGAALRGADKTIEDVAPLQSADERQISFLDNIRYKEQYLKSKAGACIVAPAMADLAPNGMSVLVTSNPYKTYAQIAQIFYPDAYPSAQIHPSANIGKDVTLGAGVHIAAGVVIGDQAIIGDGCWIEPNAVIGAGVQMGTKCRIGACATVSHALLGDHVRLYPGVRVGQDGFGFAIDPAGHVKVPQLGRVIIEDHVEVGANSTIDRGAGPDTVIGAGTWIDNLVQIGHNVKIGRGCVLVAQSGVAGSTVLEDYAVLAAQSGVAGHLTIGKGAQIGAKAGVMRDVPAGEVQLGAPAMPVKEFMRQVATLKRLTKTQKTE